MNHTLGTRGQSLVGQPMRDDFELFNAVMEDRFDAARNPSGKIPLCIAENVLIWPEVSAKVTEIMRQNQLPDWTGQYTAVGGNEDFRRAVIGFLQREIADTPLDLNCLGASAGATAIVELTAFLLGDAGDTCVLPAPAYQVYAHDVGAKAGLDIRFAQSLTNAALDALKNDLGPRFRMLVLTSPNNPDGTIYTRKDLERLADWCIQNQVHLVVNELYFLSKFELNGQYSFLHLLEDRRSPYLHWWYSLSKDFGLSGFRVGLLYSRNEALLTGFNNIGAPHCTSNLTQWIVQHLLGDADWVSSLVRTNRHRLEAAYRTVTDTLDELSIPYAPSKGSLFVWADFSAYLDDHDDGAERRLWERVFKEAGVLLTAPGGFGNRERGWFRLVYSCVGEEELKEAMGRLRSFGA